MSLLAREPVALMRLVEIPNVEVAEDAMQVRNISPRALMVEPKFNGWLTQVVNGRLFTRRGKELTHKFPAIVDQLRRFKGDHLLGELVYWDDVGMMNERAVTHVAGTKDPAAAVRKLEAAAGEFQIILFDAIALNGKDISRESTIWRRMRLEELDIQETWDLALSPLYDLSEWKGVYDHNLCHGGDGIVLKNPDAPYDWRPLGQHEARPSGTWFKIKPFFTDDFVVMGTHRGPRGKLLLELGQYHNGRLIFVSDMNNLSLAKENEFLRLLKKGTVVVEAKFQSRFPGSPGALQNPRLVRIREREDKDPHSVTLPERYAE